MSPMPPAVPTLLEHLRNHLEGLGLVRKPPAGGTTPPMWLQPQDGTPAPGESPSDNAAEVHPDLVTALYLLPGPPTTAYEGDTWRYDVVEIRYRARKAPFASDLERLIRQALHDRRDYDLAGKRVIESLIARELAPLGSGPQGFTFGQQYLFQTYLVNP